jgi:hypothetical protein
MVRKTQKTRKACKIIQWTGPGSKITGLHTKKEFLDIMRKEFPEVYYRRRMKGQLGPQSGQIKYDDLAGWMKFVGARC